MRTQSFITTLAVCFIGLIASSDRAQGDCSKILQTLLDGPPQKLSDLGIFEDLVTLKTCSSLIEYDVNISFWSDGATKRRWYIPPKDQKIEFNPTDPWKFPAGSVFVKHFELQTGASSFRKIETRVLGNHGEDDWVGYSYQWQEDQKNANLLDDSTTQDYLVWNSLDPLHPKNQTWIFPSQSSCLTCHNSWSGYVLGPRTEQINLTPQGKTKNQLDQWNENNFFTNKINPAAQYMTYIPLSDRTQPLEKRIKSYLATNCAQCHQPESPVRTQMDFRFKTPWASMNLIGKKPNAGNLGNDQALLVKPGSKENSILWLRLKATGTQHMPPLGTNELDQQAIHAVGEWIDHL